MKKFLQKKRKIIKNAKKIKKFILEKHPKLNKKKYEKNKLFCVCIQSCRDRVDLTVYPIIVRRCLLNIRLCSWNECQ